VGEGGAVEEGELGLDFRARTLTKSSSSLSCDDVRDIGFERLL